MEPQSLPQYWSVPWLQESGPWLEMKLELLLEPRLPELKKLGESQLEFPAREHSPAATSQQPISSQIRSRICACKHCHIDRESPQIHSSSCSRVFHVWSELILLMAIRRASRAPLGNAPTIPTRQSLYLPWKYPR